MKPTFRVLVLDDTIETLDNISRAILTKNKYLVDDIEWEIELEVINITFEQIDGKSYISSKTFKQLSDACSESFNLILTDYGYIPAENKHKVIELSKKATVAADEFEGLVFYPKHLSEHLAIYESRHIEGINFPLLRNYFFNHEGKIFIYTYSPPPWDPYVPQGALRKGEVKLRFPKSKEGSNFILVWEDIFNKAAKPVVEVLDKTFISIVIARFLNEVIKNELYSYIIDKSKQVRKFRQRKQFIFIAAIGALIGVSSELMGKWITIIWVDSELKNGIKLFASVCIAVSCILVLYIFTKFMHDKYEKSEEEKGF